MVIAACTAATLWLIARYHPAGVTLKSQLDPIAVVALAVTIFIAYFVQHYLGRKAVESRVEKDLLIQDLREAQAALRRVREGYRKAPEDRPELLAQLRQLVNQLSDAKASLNESRYRSLAANMNGLFESYLLMKKTLTSGPPPTTAPDPQTAQAMVARYADLNRQLQRLIFLINRQSL